MIFSRRHPVTFIGNAVEYVAYILDRNPTSASVKHASLIDILKKHALYLRDIIACDSIC
uniref:Uncharacterized protein n=1 Tax=Peronospora matthiolae TaxID=2874970 RepID=A0AAV1T6L6_9STRA